MALALFAGIYVRDFPAAVDWYNRLFGAEPDMFPHDTEAVWELAEHRSFFVELDAARAGHAAHTLFLDDLDATVAAITGRGIEPVDRETYGNGVRKITYRDPDGNEIGFGGGPA